MTDVSVVVPFYNPGADLDDCVLSLVDQTLADDRYEILLVDDGSNDDSGPRAAQWAARHPTLIQVRHEPHSGGPAHPRNVGIAAATGRYIQFVDSDDALAPEALEKLVRIADESSADIVASKISAGGPRPVHHPLFRRTVTGLTIDDCPLLVHYGTVCKLFRRDFLLAHRVRFPESSHREDQHFCMRTYALAQSIAIAADQVYYFNQRRRSAGDHFGDAALEPDTLVADIGGLLDVVDTEMPTPRARRVAAQRIYRGPILGRLRGKEMLRYDDAQRASLVSALRALALGRLPEDVRSGLPAFTRVQSRLLLDGDVVGLTGYAQRLDELRLRASATEPRWCDGRLEVDVTAQLQRGSEPLRLEPLDAGWALPEWLAPGVAAAERRLASLDDPDELDLDLAAVAQADQALWSTTDGLRLRIEPSGETVIGGRVALDPTTLAGGRPMSTGRWDLRLRVLVEGLSRAGGLRPGPDVAARASARWSAPAGRPCAVTAGWRGKPRRLALDVES